MLSENPNGPLLAETVGKSENVIFLYSQTDESKNSKYIKILNLIMFFSVFFRWCQFHCLGKCSHWIYSCKLWRKSFFPSLVNEKIFHSQWMKIFLHCEWKFSFTVNENRIFFIVYKNKFNEIFFQTMKSASLIKSIWMGNLKNIIFQ